MVVSYFSKVGVLFKQLKVVVMLNKNIWDNITVVVKINALHKEFEYITFRLLEQEEEKSMSKTQSILLSNKTKLLSKRLIGVTTKLVHMSRRNNQKCKVMATSKEKYFNCYKMKHFRQDCRMPD